MSCIVVPAVRRVPHVGDKILVPNNKYPKTPVVAELVGGWATVHRIVCAQNGSKPSLHFVRVLEHTPYEEYNWEEYLEPLQDGLRQVYEPWEMAYFKPV